MEKLVTPEPHYIPGYAGYCPQLKYHMGKPYSQLTAHLLTSPEISHSPRLVLSSGLSPSAERDTGAREEIWRRGTRQCKTPQRMIPGYTGFIPRIQNYFSKTYAETCREAISEFDSDQKVRIRPATADKLPAVERAFPDIKPRKLNTPLVAISKEAIPYKSLDYWRPLDSPYSMDDSNPHKYFISGFAGYVPRARYLMGSSFPITTNKALIQFGKQMKASHSALGLTRERDDNLVSAPIIYPTHRGLLPRYTGHVPGYKFRYGQTFGQLTSNSLDVSGTRRKIDTE
ncbi:ciliary microtubule inner protein 2B [Tachysurus vachellii]|uniref:ciliary microtubule inner protein 2B n=1 Tax=Tachysurus vachellii TaxID=175792 RepID=UPI00296B098E|nr:ciliary microtubule inner protein 2B [Tachysurus vachellii]